MASDPYFGLPKITEPKCKHADQAGQCSIKDLRCPCFDFQMCIPCNIPIEEKCRICEYRVNNETVKQ